MSEYDDSIVDWLKVQRSVANLHSSKIRGRLKAISLLNLKTLIYILGSQPLNCTELTKATRKSTSSMERLPSQRAFAHKLREFLVQWTARRAQKTKPKLIDSKNPAQSAEGFNQSLKAQRSTRRAQRDKSKLKAQNLYAYSAEGDQAAHLGLRKATHKSRKPVKAWALRRTDVYLWFLYLLCYTH